MNLTLFKTLQFLIKTVVFSGLALMTLHVALLLLGINEPFSEWLCGFSLGGFALLLIAGTVLKLCTPFKIALYYAFVAEQCIILQREFSIFGESLPLIRSIVLCLGVLLIILIIEHEYFKQKTNWKVDH